MNIKFPMTHYEWMKNHGVTLITDDIFKKFGKTYDLGFTEFADYFVNMPLISDFFDSNSLNNTNLFARQIYHCYKMMQHREKIYYLSKEVCELLKTTKLTIDAEFIESPFEQIYLYTDQNDFMLTDNTGSMAMKGVYLQLAIENNKKLLRFIVTSGIEGIDKHLDINYFATFEIPEHGDLETIANRDIQKFIMDKKVINHDVNLNIMRNVFIFSVNALLYIGCKNVDFINFTPDNLKESLERKKNTAKKEKIERLISKTAQIPFIIVNPKKGESDKDGVKGIGNKLDHQVLVSGHWRGQWSGSEDNRTKEIIRIKSYLKGIGLKDGENKPFLVK
jgi:hypothetical protein